MNNVRDVVRSQTFRRIRMAINASCESAGVRLLTYYQGLSAASRGRLPYREVRPRIVGATAAALATLLFVGLSATLLNAALAWRHVDHRPAPAPVDYAYVIRCCQCNWERPLQPAEVGNSPTPYGAYRCDNCRSFTAYPHRLRREFLGPPASSGGGP